MLYHRCVISSYCCNTNILLLSHCCYSIVLLLTNSLLLNHLIVDYLWLYRIRLLYHVLYPHIVVISSSCCYVVTMLFYHHLVVIASSCCYIIILSLYRNIDVISSVCYIIILLQYQHLVAVSLLQHRLVVNKQLVVKSSSCWSFVVIQDTGERDVWHGLSKAQGWARLWGAWRVTWVILIGQREITYKKAIRECVPSTSVVGTPRGMFLHPMWRALGGWEI